MIVFHNYTILIFSQPISRRLAVGGLAGKFTSYGFGVEMDITLNGSFPNYVPSGGGIALSAPKPLSWTGGGAGYVEGMYNLDSSLNQLNKRMPNLRE